jgi:hypothetical protein
MRGLGKKGAIATAGCLLLLGVLLPASASAAFGLLPGSEGFDGGLWTESGEAATLAGSHPHSATTKFRLNTRPHPTSGEPIPDGDLKDVRVELPAGLVGNAEATPKCRREQIRTEPISCPAASQVGVANLTFGTFAGPLPTPPLPIYNMEPPPGQPAQFAFVYAAVINLDVEVRSGDDYGLTISLNNLPQTLPVVASEVEFWGMPADPSHDSQRRCPGTEETGCASGADEVPLLSLPTACSGPLETRIHVSSWQQPGVFDSSTFLSHDAGGEPVGVEDCADLNFPATISADAGTSAAASPSALGIGIHVPQDESPVGRAVANLKGAAITLPEGMAINPSAATGLGACSPAQVGLKSPLPATCPNSSKIGTVRIDTPLLDHPLHGAVYQAQPHENPFGSLLALYIATHDPESGVVLKIAGNVIADPESGRLTIRFDDNPQLPFEEMQVEMFGGQRAALVTPPACGTHTASASLTPFSGAAPASSSSSFDLTGGPNGGPCPNGSLQAGLEAGTANPLAGAYSPFALRLQRADGTQELRSVAATLPRGLLAKLRGIPYCSDTALAAIPRTQGTGAGQLASSSCPAASEVGRVSARMGAGPSPFQLDSGRVYLAGPYKGAPLSLALVTPALAGPLDLGNVVVRTALDVDPVTAQVRAVSDPLPRVLFGIPLNIRQIDLDLDRPGFTLNPTSCEPTGVSADVLGVAGAAATLGNRFQVGSCGRLRFKPKLNLRLAGGTKRGAYPALTGTLKMRGGEANIRRASVALPRSEFLAQEHIRTICTRVQWASDSCPKAAIYGQAEAVTPLLDEPLKGPVYLRSSDNELPDLVADLQGQIDIELVGRIDSFKRGIRTTFESVPDAPVNKFVLRMRGGKKSLLVNSTDICRARQRATVQMDGQNGRGHDSRPVVKAGCGKKTNTSGRKSR